MALILVSVLKMISVRAVSEHGSENKQERKKRKEGNNEGQKKCCNLSARGGMAKCVKRKK